MIKKNSEDYNSRDAAQRTLLVALHNRSVDLDHILEEARRELLAIHPDVLLEVLLDREMVVEQLAVQSDLRARLFHHVVVLPLLERVVQSRLFLETASLSPRLHVLVVEVEEIFVVRGASHATLDGLQRLRRTEQHRVPIHRTFCLRTSSRGRRTQ